MPEFCRIITRSPVAGLRNRFWEAPLHDSSVMVGHSDKAGLVRRRVNPVNCPQEAFEGILSKSMKLA